jgi:hypothetical protein
MTAEDKRDRRNARHELQRCFRVIATHQIGLSATHKQLTAATKLMADRYYAEQVRPTAERIERELIAEAEEKAAAAV